MPVLITFIAIIIFFMYIKSKIIRRFINASVKQIPGALKKEAERRDKNK